MDQCPSCKNEKNKVVDRSNKRCFKSLKYSYRIDFIPNRKKNPPPLRANESKLNFGIIKGRANDAPWRIDRVKRHSPGYKQSKLNFTPFNEENSPVYPTFFFPLNFSHVGGLFILKTRKIFLTAPFKNRRNSFHRAPWKPRGVISPRATLLVWCFN